MFFKTFESRPEFAEAAGFIVLPRRFDSPVPHLEEIDFAAFAKPRALPGIDLRAGPALELLARLKPFAAELDAIPYEFSADAPFWFTPEFLESFPDYDIAVLYSLLRQLKPKRYVELGCGYSSLVSSYALQRNQQEGAACDAVYADPEPRLPLDKVLAFGRLIRKRVQALPLDLFTKLEAGDVLFIDTSHVLKIQSDVEHELLRILPSLAPGVWIHFHDVFTPYDYPEEWVRQPLRLWANEQYGVESLLSGGSRYQIEIPLHYLVRDHLTAVREFYPRGRRRGQSLWLRKIL
jgi:predicted O-methyltransferase YrrM